MPNKLSCVLEYNNNILTIIACAFVWASRLPMGRFDGQLHYQYE